MKLHQSWLNLGMVAVLMLSTPSYGQRIPDAGSLMNQTERNSTFRRTIPDYLPPKENLPPELNTQDLSALHFKLESLQIKGNKLIKTADLLAAVHTPMPTLISSGDQLRSIIGDLVARYRQDGWIVKAYVAQQSLDPLEGGTLKIQIVENLAGSSP
jgi:hemolysin activation/secretion protein